MIVSISFDFEDSIPDIQEFKEPLEIELIYQIEKEDLIMVNDSGRNLPPESHSIDSTGLGQKRRSEHQKE
jgi:hypothetical protein